MSASRVGSAARATIDAAGPLCIAVCVLVTLPTLLFFLLLTALGLPLRDTAPVYWTGLLLPISLLAHEFGHTLTAVLLLRSAVGIQGQGTWRSASILRPAHTVRGDALIAVAGPVAGVSCALPVVFVAGSPVMGAIWAAPFLAHLVSLRPTGSDGRQVLGVLRARSGDAPR